MAESRQLTSFFVTTKMSTSSQRDTLDIDDQTAGAKHIIELENTTPVRRDGQVVAVLAAGTVYITFNDGSGPIGRWSRDCPEYEDMLHAETRSGEFPLEHVKAASVRQPIHIEQVNTRRGNGNWVADKSGALPFGIYINVK